MDETTATILYGCKLAKELEANLPNWANQPAIISTKTEEILAVFNNIKERLSHQIHHHHQQQQQQQLGGGGGAGVQELLSGSGGASSMQALELFHAAEILGETAAAFAVHGLPESDQMGGGESSMRLQQVVGQAMEVSNSSRAGGSSSSSSSQRQRRRTGDTDRRTVRMAAPRMGNLEFPPEDGYTWRKYGQKEILGSRYPRAYYRCTHQKLYNCPAKKQVQRLDDDPYIFEVTYRSQHTCYMSATAPSVPPQQVEDITHQATTPPPPPLMLPPSTSASLSGHWLSMDIKPQLGEGTSNAPFDIQRNFAHSASGSLASICNVVTSGTGPSGGRYGREVDYQPVVDMADAMFNSGSSSNNSMDLIFSSIDDKWDSAEKKE